MGKRTYQKRKKLTNSMVRNMKPEAAYYDVADSEQPGLKVRVQPNGNKHYHCRYTMPDGRRGSTKVCCGLTFTVAEARQMARSILLDVSKGIDPNAKKPEAETLRAFLDNIYAPRATHKTANETVARVKRSFADLLDKPLADIRPMWVENWKKARLTAGKAKSTVNRDIDALRGVLSRAVEWDCLAEHPLRRVKKFKLDGQAPPRYLNPAELKLLHKALDTREGKLRDKRKRFNDWRRERGYSEYQDLEKTAFADYVKPMTLLALNSGLRRGELFHLRWEFVDLEGAMLTVDGAMAKSGKTRHIPLNGVALDALTGWRDQTTGEGLVFPSPKGGGVMDNIAKSWRDVTTSAKLDNFRFHDCRHHFASMLVQRGADLNTVRELLGHSDLKLTLRYAHLAPANAARAVALLDAPGNVVPIAQSAGQ